jgi:hypothetical protein
MVLISKSSYFGSPSAGVDEAIVSTVAKDHMVENADTEQLSGLTQASRQIDVL